MSRENDRMFSRLPCHEVLLQAGLKWLLVLLFFFVFVVGVAGAGAEQQINERLKAGGTVYLLVIVTK